MPLLCSLSSPHPIPNSPASTIFFIGPGRLRRIEAGENVGLCPTSQYGFWTQEEMDEAFGLTDRTIREITKKFGTELFGIREEYGKKIKTINEKLLNSSAWLIEKAF